MQIKYSKKVASIDKVHVRKPKKLNRWFIVFQNEFPAKILKWLYGG